MKKFLIALAAATSMACAIAPPFESTFAKRTPVSDVVDIVDNGDLIKAYYRLSGINVVIVSMDLSSVDGHCKIISTSDNGWYKTFPLEEFCKDLRSDVINRVFPPLE